METEKAKFASKWMRPSRERVNYASSVIHATKPRMECYLMTGDAVSVARSCHRSWRIAWFHPESADDTRRCFRHPLVNWGVS